MSSGTPPATTTRDPSQRLAIRALLTLVAVTALLALGAGAYLLTRPAPAPSGLGAFGGGWVGPGNFQGSGDPYTLEVYLSLKQEQLVIVGSGTLCAFTSSVEDGVTNTTLATLPVSATARISGASLSLTLYITEGADPAIFPPEMRAQGGLSEGQLTLSAESPAHLLLTLQHGSQDDFTAACDQLAQPTETPTPEPSATPGG